ncbi:GTP-binding protein EngA [Limihaloglobus sulfuriphilus]|uniref:GTPase Der n=1 Tax=Limihaloglobus sulfuriphilus TaxID=1851148 RepID=A0A1Q2MCA1_9BACT|nr:ribosome biogenesis GTPase Der [Limihaloglobus sulfuriphilus]AQQ70294.1 GTP-binding protein EngA [Limihaloglobus sulfuriphilus]
MALPSVAIVGRPNVGKSSLLNALAGSMISIVEPTAGVTRDRISVPVRHGERYLELIDTGGYGIVDSDKLEDQIEIQINQAINHADLILFIVDINDGITPLDKTIAGLLRKSDSNVILVANKADSARLFPRAGEFTKLGFGDALCISALNHLNKKDLMDLVFDRLEGHDFQKPEEPVMKIALVGKRNAGKSSFINAIVGQQRVIVSEVAGTTRDAVDVRFERDGQSFVAIDTAGLRKKKVLSKDNIDFYSYTRALKSIRRADVVLFMIDAMLPVSQVDKKLAYSISEEHKPCILVVNKWDLAADKAEAEDFSEYLSEELPGLRHCPIAFTTAKDGRNIQSTLDLARELHKQSTIKIPTPMLNKAMDEIKQMRVGGNKKKKGFPKIYYATQIATQPITVLVFVNNPEYFDGNYQRFMLNRLGEMLPCSEVPIKLMFKSHRAQTSR